MFLVVLLTVPCAKMTPGQLTILLSVPGTAYNSYPIVNCPPTKKLDLIMILGLRRYNGLLLDDFETFLNDLLMYGGFWESNMGRCCIILRLCHTLRLPLIITW